MAELADALDLGSSVPDVRVQVSLSAPRSKKVNLAGIAQLVEHNLAKVRVASSSLVFRSKQKFSYSCLVRPLKRAYLLEGVLYLDLSKKRKRKHCTTHLILLPLHEIVE